MANPNYAIPATFAIEQVLPTKFSQIAESSHPFLAKILGRNEMAPAPSFMVENRNFGGTLLIMPVAAALMSVVEGVTEAGHWTAQSVTQPASGSASHAEYAFANYRGHVSLSAREARLLEDNPQSRRGLSIVTQRVESMRAEFNVDMETDVSGASAAAEDAMQGMRQGLSVSASPGNISQTTYAAWQANVDAVSAAYNITTILRGINLTRFDRVRGLQIADLCFASEVTTGYVFSAIQNTVGANGIVNDATLGNFGHLHLTLQHNTVVVPQTVVAQEVYYFTTDKWAYVGDAIPQVLPPSPARVPGGTILSWEYTLMASLGCNDWGAQAVQTGISTS